MVIMPIFIYFISSIISIPKGIRSSLSSSDEVFLYLMRYVHYWIMYIVYHAPRGTKLSGTENAFYEDLEILFTDASISVVPVIILGDFNIHFNNALKSLKFVAGFSADATCIRLYTCKREYP